MKHMKNKVFQWFGKSSAFSKKINYRNITRIEISIAVVLVLSLSLYLLGNPNITGFLSLDLIKQDLNITLTKSQIYTLTSTDPSSFILTSFKMSGEVTGDGRIEIYIDNNQGQQLLVYRNVKSKNRGMGIITGLFTEGEKLTEKENAKQKSYLIISPGKIIQNAEMQEITEKEETVSGTFSNECSETCFIKMELSSNIVYNLVFRIEPGTALKIDNIFYTIK